MASVSGFYSCGVAQACPVDPGVGEFYDKWLSDGKNGNMAYLGNYPEIRRDPRLLLDGAKSVIVLAMSYFHPVGNNENQCCFAMYAHGDDYHEVLREKVKPIVDFIAEAGGTSRVCIDSAPILERYWAVRSGVGYIGRNSLLIIPHAGSYFFLCEIVTTLELPADAPCTMTCGDCMACVKNCPGKAIENRHIDARRCRSYLTIEYRGELPDNTELTSVYGCDICQQVCPHNLRPPVTPLSEFYLRPAIAELTPSDISNMPQEQFSAIFRHSPVKRTKLTGLKRNVQKLKRK